jgi:hypothetical protein
MMVHIKAFEIEVENKLQVGLKNQILLLNSSPVFHRTGAKSKWTKTPTKQVLSFDAISLP